MSNIKGTKDIIRFNKNYTKSIDKIIKYNIKLCDCDFCKIICQTSSENNDHVY